MFHLPKKGGETYMAKPREFSLLGYSIASWAALALFVILLGAGAAYLGVIKLAAAPVGAAPPEVVSVGGCGADKVAALQTRTKNSLDPTESTSYLAANVKFWEKGGDHIADVATPSDGSYANVSTLNCPTTVTYLVVQSPSVYGTSADATANAAYTRVTIPVDAVGTLQLRAFDPSINDFISNWGDATTSSVNITTGLPYDLTIKAKVVTSNAEFGGDKLVICTSYNLTEYTSNGVFVPSATEISVPTIASGDNMKKCFTTNRNNVKYTDGIVEFPLKFDTASGIDPSDDVVVKFYDTSKYLGKDGKTIKSGIGDDDNNDVGGTNVGVTIDVV